MKHSKIKMCVYILNKYSIEEFGNEIDVNDLEDIGIAYSINEKDTVEIQCSVDIIHNKMKTYWNSILVKEEQYNDEDFIEVLKNLDFDNLIYESENF